jgi:hypothetical protein
MLKIVFLKKGAARNKDAARVRKADPLQGRDKEANSK